MTNPPFPWRRARLGPRPFLETLETRLYLAGSFGFTYGAQSGAHDTTRIATLRKPATPSRLAAKATSSSVDLTWRDNAANETGLQVFRSTDGRSYMIVATLPADSNSWTDTSVAANTRYWYKISEYNPAGASTTSARKLTTPNAPPTPATPASVPPLTLPATVPTPTESVIVSAPTTPPAPAKPIATPVPTTSEIAPTPTTATPPPPPPPTIGGVTYATANMTSFNELVIDGTSGNDSIDVAQSNGILTITANQQTTTYAATFGDIKIYGINGNDSITVDSSVNIATLIYGGDGSDTIQALGSAKMTVVTIGNGTSTITGNGINTAYWVNPGDTVNASASEIALGGVNRVDNFYQPFTTNSTDPNYISRNLYGQNLTDPTDSGVTIRRQNSSFWGTGPTKDDINQGQIADCYYVAGLSAIAYTMPQKLMNMGVDLGDGTYAVRYVRNHIASYVRVDGDLYAGSAAPGVSGNQWAGLFEKAYAFFLGGANTYASLNYGSPSGALSDAGLNSTTISTSDLLQTTLQNLIDAALAADKPMVAGTTATIAAGAPLVGLHLYTVIGCYLDASGQLMIQLRNPWGYDGAGNDGNSNDGIVTISYNQFASNTDALSYAL